MNTKLQEAASLLKELKKELDESPEWDAAFSIEVGNVISTLAYIENVMKVRA